MKVSEATIIPYEINHQDAIFSMTHRNELHFGDEMFCVYWDFLAMSWSDKGCHLVRDQSNRN